jgi:hypothetical protein
MSNPEDKSYFVTRLGSVGYNLLKSHYDEHIKPNVLRRDFIPDNEYLEELFRSDYHFSFILDEVSFHSFISDIQTISTLNFYDNLKTQWNEIRNYPFIYCIFVPDENIKNKINSEESNLLSKHNMNSIKIDFVKYPVGMNDPQLVIEHYLIKIQTSSARIEVPNKRGSSITPSKTLSEKKFTYIPTPYNRNNE